MRPPKPRPAEGRGAVHRRIRKSPLRLLVPVLLGLGLLAWALELGRDRGRPSRAERTLSP